MKLETDRLELRLQSPTEVLRWVESLPPEVQEELAIDWLSRLRQATGPDPWACMFAISQKHDGVQVGTCGFKAPPDALGMVEIAYGIDEAFCHHGYATEAAHALIDFATTVDAVKTVRANTKIENEASQRVLQKLEFTLCGQFEEPDDGLVNRWQIEIN